MVTHSQKILVFSKIKVNILGETNSLMVCSFLNTASIVLKEFDKDLASSVQHATITHTAHQSNQECIIQINQQSFTITNVQSSRPVTKLRGFGREYILDI